ncbi:MAG: 50S ribosomal protein L11 methyltransferase [Novosphingobium sp.]|uniref:50S ribosomal protein L11 methyltransferase n=1 Tax=Novosphingobium sp. TaxID=1874826 RepID=UPI003B9ABC96
MSGTLSEHRGYLVDTRRVARYGDAIDRVVSQGDTVVDLGCGFGILGLMCLKAGAAKAWGIDATDAIDIARETAGRAGLGDRYHCIHDQTFRAELPEKVDVLICDHVGYFGVDYGIVLLMADARRRFLKPGGRIIPERLELYLVGIRSGGCRQMLDVWEVDDVPADYAWLRSYAVNTKHVVDLVPTEIATAPVVSGHVVLGEDAPETLVFKAMLEIDEDGALDGIGGWFACELGAGISMTNSPLARDAICRHQIFLGFEKPLAVKAGDKVEVSVRLSQRSGVIAWSVRDPASGRLQRYSSWAAMPMSAGERLKPHSTPRHLNDRGRALSVVLGYLDQSLTGLEIEEAILREHPALFPSADETARFVKDVLADYTA